MTTEVTTYESIEPNPNRESRCSNSHVTKRLFRHATAACLLATAMAPGLAAADDDFESPITNGAWRTSISAGLTGVGTEAEADEQDITNYGANAQISFGRFISRHVEINLNVSGSGSWNNNNNNRSGSVGYTVGAKYNFMPEERLVPYLGLRLGAQTKISTVSSFTPGGGSVNRTDVTTNASVGGSVGFEYFLSESSSFFMEYGLDVEPRSDAVVYNNAAQIGLSFWF